jgi:hypothetical protein
LDIRGPADGYWVVETETALKKFFKSKGLLLSASSGEKFDGYTESWRASETRFANLSELLAELRVWEG